MQWCWWLGSLKTGSKHCLWYWCAYYRCPAQVALYYYGLSWVVLILCFFMLLSLCRALSVFWAPLSCGACQALIPGPGLFSFHLLSLGQINCSFIFFLSFVKEMILSCAFPLDLTNHRSWLYYNAVSRIGWPRKVLVINSKSIASKVQMSLSTTLTYTKSYSQDISWENKCQITMRFFFIPT